MTTVWNPNTSTIVSPTQPQSTNVLQFGADPTGTFDSSAAFQAAINSFGTLGGKLILGPGSFLIGSQLSVNCPLIFEGKGAFGSGTQIVCTSATINVFDIVTSGVWFRDILFTSNVTRTAGAYICFDNGSSVGYVQDCYMLNWYWGVRIVPNAGPFYVRNLLCKNGSPGAGQAARVDGGTDITFDYLVVDNPVGSLPDSGVCVTGCGDVSLINCQLQHCNFGLSVVPAANQVAASVYAVNTFFDNSGVNGVRIKPLSATSCAIQRVRLVSCWASDSGSEGILIDNSSTGGYGGIQAVQLTALECYGNSNGVAINITGTSQGQVIIQGGFFAGNSNDGIQIFNGNDVTIDGAKCGPAGGFFGNTGYGIQALGVSNNLTITNCNLTNNTAGAFADSGSGTFKTFANNNGLNNSISRTNAVTPTGSPFTYTAGPTQETAYIFGGTVSSVVVDGANVFATTNCTVSLGPGKVMQITYSSTPSIVITHL